MQVAAGEHHCLALCTPGLVWAWGRNKAGQLGDNTKRDKVQPVEVLKPSDNPGNKVQLGFGTPQSRIITLNAGGRSSIAAAYDSTIWQWGEVNSGFQGDAKSSKGKEDKGLDAKTEVPYQVFTKEYYLTTCRKGMQGEVKITGSGCRVLPTYTSGASAAHERIKDLVTSIHQLQEAIAKGREELDKRNKGINEEIGGKGGDSNVTEKNDFQETIALLKRDMHTLKGEVEMLDKANESLKLQKYHTQKQIEEAAERKSRLEGMQDEKRKQKRDAKAGSDRKKLEDELAEIRQLIEANRSAEETLQRQQNQNKEEMSSIEQKLKDKRAAHTGQDSRLKTLQNVSEGLATSAGASDSLVIFLKEQNDEFRQRFENRKDKPTYQVAALDFEDDAVFLRGVEQRVNEFCDKTGEDYAQKSKLVRDMLHDLVSLRRSWNEMLLDKWDKDAKEEWHNFFDRGETKKHSHLHLRPR